MNEQSSLQIRPYEGLGPVSFGMKAENVHAKLGNPDTYEDDEITAIEKRPNMEFRYLKGGLNIITGFNDAPIFYNDYHIFRTPNLLELLSQEDTPSKEKNGYISFYKLGFALGGFGKRKLKEGKIVVMLPSAQTLEMFVSV